jgi:hypothetical protein
LQSWCSYCVLICVLTNADDFVEMFRAKTSYRIVEPAHMVFFFVALAFLYLLFFLCEKETFNLLMHLKLLEPSMFFVQISTVPVRLGNLDQHVLNINTFSFIITNLGILCLVQV